MKKEIRVYVIESETTGEKHYTELNNEEFIDIAEEEGRVYTLKGFQEAFNLEEINSAIDIIRFIEVVCVDESLMEEL